VNLHVNCQHLTREFTQLFQFPAAAACQNPELPVLETGKLRGRWDVGVTTGNVRGLTQALINVANTNTNPTHSNLSNSTYPSPLAHVRMGVKLPAYSSEMNVAVIVWLHLRTLLAPNLYPTF